MMPQRERLCPQHEESSPCTPKKGVQWVSRVKLYLFEPRTDDTLDELWYSETDYKRFKAESRSLITKARRNSLESAYQAKVSVLNNTSPRSVVPEDDESTRGLEHFICNERKHLRYQRRKKAVDLVWNEQVRQWDAGEVSPQLIAEQYRKVSEMCQIQAQMQGYTYFIENTFGHQLQDKKDQFVKSFLFTDSAQQAGIQMRMTPKMIEKKQLTSPLA